MCRGAELYKLGWNAERTAECTINRDAKTIQNNKRRQKQHTCMRTTRNTALRDTVSVLRGAKPAARKVGAPLMAESIVVCMVMLCGGMC